MKQIIGKSLPEFIMMVGPSGAGKSTIASEFGYPVVSTDKIRQNLYGLDSSGKINGFAYTKTGFYETFTAAEHIVEAYLYAGQSVVYDATNIKAKDRIAFLTNVGLCDMRPIIEASVTYCVVDRPLEEKENSYLFNVNKNGSVAHTDIDVIRKHHEEFQKHSEYLFLNKDVPGLNITIKDMRKKDA